VVDAAQTPAAACPDRLTRVIDQEANFRQDAFAFNRFRRFP
jgi:hypothetical protein